MEVNILGLIDIIFPKMKNNKTIKENFDFAFENHKKNNLKVAEEIYKKILEEDPKHFPSTVLLGTLSAQIKNFDLAKQLLEKAIKINSNHPEAHYNLGLVFNQLADFEKAINCFEKAIKIKPDYAEAYNNLGNSYKGLKNFEKAITYYEKTIEVNSSYADAYNNLGIAFKSLGNEKAAIDCYKKTIQLEPNHPEAHYNFGIVLKELGEELQAINYYEKAIKIKPDYADAYNNLGNCYEALGNFQEAINCYERAIKSLPDNLGYFYSLSRFKTEILNSNLRNSIEKIINDNNCTKRNMAFGNFLLAKCESKEKNYEKEIDYLIKGHVNYFELKKEKFTRQIKYFFDVLPNTNELIDLKKTDEIVSKHEIKPIFIIGVPRCGSTLTEKIIASSSKYIPIGEETGILEKIIKQKIENKQLLNFEKNIFQMELFEAYNHKGLVQKNSGYTFTDKSLENFFYIGIIKEIFPNAKVVHCRRNALSSIMSIFKNNMVDIGWAHNLEYIFKYFDIYYQMLENFRKIYPNFIYELDYEKFVNNPEVESKKLLNYCDLPWDKKCLEFYKRKDLISKTASNIQIRQTVYKHSSDKYLPYKKLLDKYGNKYSWFN